jgi:hypothetical protein
MVRLTAKDWATWRRVDFLVKVFRSGQLLFTIGLLNTIHELTIKTKKI